VNSYLAITALVFAISLMLTLPLLPALLELKRKSDALPLSVIQQNAGEIRHFANSFRTYVQKLQPLLQQCTAAGATDTGKLGDDEEYVVLGRADEPLMLALQQRDALRPVVIAAGVDLAIPDGGTFSKEIFAAAQFIGGEKNRYRAILGEKNIWLGEASQVTRWVHAAGEFTAGPGSSLHGRVSSDLLIRLQNNCRFVRLNAPRIEAGLATDPADTIPSDATCPASQQRLLHDGDFVVKPGQAINCNIVVRGKLRICAGARVHGSVKSEQTMILEEGVSVEGSLISASRMQVGPRCSIHGPVIAERELSIATGTHCGSSKRPTTVSAPRIKVEEGVTVFGTLWAREGGQVVAKS